MESAEIARRWLAFFEARGHTVVPSASLIADDPTLLLVNAGMVPFKPYFLGEVPPPYPRATSIQKVVRTLDIDEVGRTTRHASFFQMCGNFSFGDYFKEKAIPLAWELLTLSQADGGFGFDEDRLWVTVYQDDDEAADLWRTVVGMPAERIQRRGLKDNYWHMGVPGPGGPCSEIYYDRGPDHGREGGPIVDEERYLEVWNLVFMQDELGEVRAKEDFDIVGSLPSKNIDTGLGLERMAALLQGVDNIYEIDTTRRIIDAAAGIADQRYGADAETDVRLRVVGDHARTAVMLIGDGVIPGNEGRGYVLRRIMRRVIRSMRLLGAQGTTINELTSTTIDAMGEQYPELQTDRGRILAVAEGEESAFLQTLRTGTTILDTAVAAARSQNRSALTGEEAFALHDTYGFPIDLTLEMAAEQGLTVDQDGFRRLMGEQRRRAQDDARAKKTGHADVSAYRGLLDAAGATDFTGYVETTTPAAIRGLLVDGESVAAASAGTQVDVVLDRSPFYAEAGGQLADAGRIVLDDGTTIEIDDVQAPVPGLFVHRGRVVAGEAEVGASALAQVDLDRRRSISRAHTATHMVHKAFREALGDTATQAGSENAPGRFRFDFAANAAVPPSVLVDVEDRVNQLLADDLLVTAETMAIDEARRSGAMALFGEKYGDTVRVVSVGDWARELCGGTHAERSGQLGVVTLLGESSIGSGVRRVEALVGVDAYRFLAKEHLLVRRLTETLKSRPEELPDRIGSLIERLKTADRDIARMRADRLKAGLADLAAAAVDVDGIAVAAFRAPDGTTGAEVRDAVVEIRGRLAGRAALVVGAGVADGKVSAVAATDEAARGRGLSARVVLAEVLAGVDGRGGGKDDIAQGGGSNPAGLDAALTAVVPHVRSTLGS